MLTLTEVSLDCLNSTRLELREGLGFWSTMYQECSLYSCLYLVLPYYTYYILLYSKLRTLTLTFIHFACYICPLCCCFASFVEPNNMHHFVDIILVSCAIQRKGQESGKAIFGPGKWEVAGDWSHGWQFCAKHAGRTGMQQSITNAQHVSVSDFDALGMCCFWLLFSSFATPKDCSLIVLTSIRIEDFSMRAEFAACRKFQDHPRVKIIVDSIISFEGTHSEVLQFAYLYPTEEENHANHRWWFDHLIKAQFTSELLVMLIWTWQGCLTLGSQEQGDCIVPEYVGIWISSRRSQSLHYQ